MKTGKLMVGLATKPIYCLLTYGSEPTESMALEDCYSPLLHRIDQAIRWRAIHPTKELPPIPKILQKLSQQPEDLQTRSKDALKELITVSEVKKGMF